MIKKKMWLIAISVVAIFGSVNAYAMMNGNNGYRNHTRNYGYSESHMSDYDRGLHNRDNYGAPRNDYDKLNGNHYNSRMHDYSKGYQRNYQGPFKDNNSRRKYDRNMYPYGDRYREDHRYQRD